MNPSRLLSVIFALLLASAPHAGQTLLNDSRITIAGVTDVEAKRRSLIEFIWGRAGFPFDRMPLLPVIRNDLSPLGPLPNLERVDTLTIEMDRGIRSYAHHFIPSVKNSRLVVLHLGHVPTFDDSKEPADDSYGMRRTLEGLLGDGYSVLAIYMPRKVDFTTSIRVLDRSDKKAHYNLFFNPTNIPPAGNSMKYFLEPVAVCLNYLGSRSSEDGFPEYTDYSMVGFSGGGWTTTVYAAIDTRIRLSFPVAGSLPLFLRSGDAIGDMEQTMETFYSIAGYPDLYILGSYPTGRRQIQILNRRDWCCFGELHHDPVLSGGLGYDDTLRDYESRVRSTLRSLGDTDIFRTEVDEAATGHMVTWDAIYDTILPELNDGQRYVASVKGDEAVAKARDGGLLVNIGGARQPTKSGLVMGVPALLRGTSGIYDVFYRDERNRLVHLSRRTFSWSRPRVVAESVISDPAAVSLALGTYEIFVLKSDYKLHWLHWDGSSHTTEIVSQFVKGLGPPIVIGAPPDRLDVFYRSWNRQLYHASRSGGKPWTIESAGGHMLDFPSVLKTGSGTFHAFVRGLDGGLWEAVRQPSGGWGGWTSISGPLGVERISGSPSAVVSDGTVLVYARTPGGSLLRFRFDGNWTYTDIGGNVVGSPTADGRGVFVRNSQGRPARFEGTSWRILDGEID